MGILLLEIVLPRFFHIYYEQILEEGYAPTKAIIGIAHMIITQDKAKMGIIVFKGELFDYTLKNPNHLSDPRKLSVSLNDTEAYTLGLVSVLMGMSPAESLAQAIIWYVTALINDPPKE